jgi:uncharacterized hydantoinase/oxoprolinase family protein
MLCADAETLSEREVRGVANRAMLKQSSTVLLAIEHVLAGRPAVERIVLSGSGEIVGRAAIAQDAALAALPLTLFGAGLAPGLAEAACAYAVARLALEEGRDGR